MGGELDPLSSFVFVAQARWRKKGYSDLCEVRREHTEEDAEIHRVEEPGLDCLFA